MFLSIAIDARDGFYAAMRLLGIDLTAGAEARSMALMQLLRGMDANGYKVHGFRSAFRDWAGDKTDFENETIEFALAHSIPDSSKAAYRRYRSLEKRARLMQAWANYCEGAELADNVVTFAG